MVLVNRSDSARKLPAVVTDDEAGMRLAVDHLASLGHRRIGHIAGPQDVSTGALRRAGFRTAADRAGLSAHNMAIETARAYTREKAGWQRCACSTASGRRPPSSPPTICSRSASMMRSASAA